MNADERREDEAMEPRGDDGRWAADDAGAPGTDGAETPWAREADEIDDANDAGDAAGVTPDPNDPSDGGPAEPVGETPGDDDGFFGKPRAEEGPSASHGPQGERFEPGISRGDPFERADGETAVTFWDKDEVPYDEGGSPDGAFDSSSVDGDGSLPEGDAIEGEEAPSRYDDGAVEHYAERPDDEVSDEGEPFGGSDEGYYPGEAGEGAAPDGGEAADIRSESSEGEGSDADGEPADAGAEGASGYAEGETSGEGDYAESASDYAEGKTPGEGESSEGEGEPEGEGGAEPPASGSPSGEPPRSPYDQEPPPPKPKGRGRVVGIVLGVVGAIVAGLCIIFFVVVPAQQQAAYQAAQEALAQQDFDTAIARLNEAGDSQEARSLLDHATQARDAIQVINEAFSSGGLTPENRESVTAAIDFLATNYPDYPDIGAYAAYADAYGKEQDGSLFQAWQGYGSLGNFQGADERASEVAALMESTYRRGQLALQERRWQDALDLFNRINGYKDSTDLASTADAQLNVSGLVDLLVPYTWGNTYLVDSGGWFDYMISFVPNTATGETGEMDITMDASNATGIVVGRYGYAITGPNTIRLQGEYNQAGEAPLKQFSGDVTVEFVTTATDHDGNVVSGDFARFSPSPIDGNFGFDAWQNLGETANMG